MERAKGSIVYEVLIVILAVMLVASIIYPKKLKDSEAENTETCRWRMDQILKAELQYQKYTGHYEDSLAVVLDFLKADSAYSQYVDSVIVGGLDSIKTRLAEFRVAEEQILTLIPQAQDTTMIDSIVKAQTEIKSEARKLAGYVEFIHDRMKNIPNTPVSDLTNAFKIIDSKEFTLDMSIVTNSVENGNLIDAEGGAKNTIQTIDEVTGMLDVVLEKLPAFKGGNLDSLYNCPTTYEPYNLVVDDTSTIKYINIYCPLDSVDVAEVESDFLRSTIGGLQLQNHGKIERGNKSWERN